MKTCYDVVSSNSSGVRDLPPIIFLHGLVDFRLSWMKAAPIIAKNTGRKAYLLDARNHGDSPRMDEMNYEALAQDVVDFMNEQGIRKAVIVGHSMGGRTAINFALKHPERTDALVVEDMTPSNVYSSKGSFIAELFRLGKDLLRTLPPEMDLDTGKRHLMELLATLANGRFFDAEKMMKFYDKDMIPIKKIGNTFMAMADLDAAATLITSDALVQNLPEQCLTYDGDALFLYGSKAFFNIEEDTSINKLFPKAVKIKIEGASHLIHIDSIDAFSEVVSDFILYRKPQHSKY